MALIRVGMAELKVGTADDQLQALGLGSCIGLALVDRTSKIGGMVHIMLPESTVSRNGVPQPGKFADTGVPALLEAVIKAGARKANLIVKLAGGAEMFTFAGKDSPRLAVGQRNSVAVKEHCKELGLRINAEDTGGTHGRTFEVDLAELKFTIRVVGKGTREL